MSFDFYKNRFVKKMVIVLLLLLQNSGWTQSTVDSLDVQINVKFNGKAIVFGEKYVSSTADTLKFENIKFYLSAFEVKHEGHVVSKEVDSYHLIDLHNTKTLRFKLPLHCVEEIEKIKFNVGIDSLTSVSGVMGGDLDPVNAMYWAWQSGFVNFKIEGSSPSCATRKNKFQFHIGGYLKPNYAMRVLDLIVDKKNFETITIDVDLGKMFSKVEIKQTNTIMTPGVQAMKMADIFQNTFSVE